MSTLGFGDITFHTDLGRAFSMLVVISGLMFLLVLMPFTFIEFFYAFTTRQISDKPLIVATAKELPSIEILAMAGAN